MIVDLGFIDYEEAYKIQKEFVRLRKLKEIGDSLLIAEHPPVFTIGRAGKSENLLVAEDFLKERGVKVLVTDRGGGITFHGPGQIVLYPIIDLNERHRDLHGYMRDIEEIAIDFLKKYAAEGKRVKGRTGVWVKDGKIAFIGIAASGWVTYHGLSININTDLRFFSMINPCGIKGLRVLNLAGVLDRAVPMSEAKEKASECFNGRFLQGKAEYEREYPVVA